MSARAKLFRIPHNLNLTLINYRVPENCNFEVDDVEKEWVWSKPFDLILSRMLGGSFADTQAFMKKAYQYVTMPSQTSRDAKLSVTATSSPAATLK